MRNTLQEKGLSKVSAFAREDVTGQGFVSLMDLYENNYLRILKLIPNLRQLDTTSTTKSPLCSFVSRVPTRLSLYLSVLERTQFTVTLRLTYYFEEQLKVVAEPDILLRVYLDAGQVERLMTTKKTPSKKQGAKATAQTFISENKVKWQRNHFLYKWLSFNLYLGHSFNIKMQSPNDLFEQKKLLNCSTCT